jgi:hypothetical protein
MKYYAWCDELDDTSLWYSSLKDLLSDARGEGEPFGPEDIVVIDLSSPKKLKGKDFKLVEMAGLAFSYDKKYRDLCEDYE